MSLTKEKMQETFIKHRQTWSPRHPGEFGQVLSFPHHHLHAMRQRLILQQNQDLAQKSHRTNRSPDVPHCIMGTLTLKVQKLDLKELVRK